MTTDSRSRRDKTMGRHGSRAAVMTKDNQGGNGAWSQIVNELVKTEIYKRSQGRLVRQFTCLASWIAFALAAWRLLPLLTVEWRVSASVAYTIAGAVLLVG